MDFFGVIVSGLLTTVSYVVIFFGVYKLYQIATDIREIKDLVTSVRRVPSSVPAPPPKPVAVSAFTSESAKDLTGEDSAAAYAEHLLRAVNAERQVENAPQEVR